MMKTLFGCSAGLLLLLAGPAASAQGTAPRAPAAGVAYAGPRFPGGPDSLRALVRRCTLPEARIAGRAFVRFEFDSLGRPTKFALLTPPAAPSPALDQATQASAHRLRAQMPAWQLPPPGAARPTPLEPPSETLLLDFGADPATAPWPYADVEPAFPALEAKLPERDRQLLAQQGRTLFDGNFGTTSRALTAFVQLQTKYPSASLRAREQGRGYAYFEVSETGAIEQVQMAGSLGRNLDAEVLRALRQLPAAATPALKQGRPVRVYYALPLTFKML